MIVFLAATSNLDICRMGGRQKNVVKKKDLAVWEGEYGGITAEGIAKRVINKYDPSSEELSRVVNRGRGTGKNADGSAVQDRGNVVGDDDDGGGGTTGPCSGSYTVQPVTDDNQHYSFVQ